MLRNFLTITLRQLRRHKGYNFLNIFGLGIGIACAGVIFLWVEDELNFDNSFPNKNRLCQVMTNQTYEGVTRTFWSTPGLLAPSIEEELPGIAKACRTASHRPLFSLGDKGVYEQGIYADSSFPSMFSLSLKEGQMAGGQSVIISDKMAKQFFGSDQGVVGRILQVDHKDQYKVSGVFEDLPGNATLRFDWIAPFAIYSKSRDWLKFWGANAPGTYALLAPGADFDAVNKQLSGFIHAKDSKVTNQAILFAMKDWHLRADFVDGKQTGGRITFVRLFAAIAWIVLVIACINFMNLATARSEKRAREVGVRKVLGAVQRSLVTQFLLEAFVQSFLSVLLGVVLMALVLPHFNNMVDKQMGLGLSNPLHLASLVVIFLFCGFVAGSYPSLYLSSFNPIFVFKGLKSKSGGASAVRKGLVVFQFVISIVLIICTVLVYQQVEHIKNRDLGYNKNNLMDMPVTGNMQKDFYKIRQDLLNTGVVENAALCNDESLNTSDNGTGYSWAGSGPNNNVLISYRAVSPEYLATMGMKIVDGRNFYSDVTLDSTQVLITENLAKLMGAGSAVGKIIRSGDQPFTVAGVVKNYVYGDMYGSPDPVVFFAQPDQAQYLYVRFKAGAPTDLVLAKVGEVLKKDNPAYPFDYNFVDDQFDKLFKSETLIGRLSRIFAGLAICISCLGLFGLSAYMAERRTREIGIRKVLGAGVSSITALLSRDFLQLVGLSALMAFPLAWWLMHRWLQGYAYRIHINWWVFAIAGAAAILIALLTVSVQSVRAALSNPVKNLRTE